MCVYRRPVPRRDVIEQHVSLLPLGQYNHYFNGMTFMSLPISISVAVVRDSKHIGIKVALVTPVASQNKLQI